VENLVRKNTKIRDTLTAFNY